MRQNLNPVQIVSSGSTTGDGVFTPVTGPMPTGGWDALRMRCSLLSGNVAAVRPGLQYSNEGKDWSEPVPLAADPDEWWTPDYPNFAGLGYTELPPTGATEKRFVRFGFFARRDTSGAVPLLVEIVFEFVPAGRQTTRAMIPPTSAATKKSHTEPMFLPVSEPVSIGDWTEVRSTMELLALSGGQATLGYWLSDDGLGWGTYDSESPHDWQAGVAKMIPGMAFEDELTTHYSPWTTVVGAGQPLARPKLLVQFGIFVRDDASPTHPNFVRVAGMVEMR